MLRLSKLADYSVVILATMARRPLELMTASHLAESTTLPAPTVAKLLKKLAKAGFLTATRGAAGGYRLKQAPERTNMASIIEVVDGPIKIAGCVGPVKDSCGHEAGCAIYGRWEPINIAIQQAFSAVMLSDLIKAEDKAIQTAFSPAIIATPEPPQCRDALRERIITMGEIDPHTAKTVEQLGTAAYPHGFTTEIETDLAPKGLSVETIRYISAQKNEPAWLLDWRLAAFALWQQRSEPNWAKLDHPPIDYQDAYYYAAPKAKKQLASLDEVDPELLRTYEKLGIPLNEQKAFAGVAVDAVFDSVSVTTTFKEELKKAGVIFCPLSEAVRDYPALVQKYLGSVVPVSDNFFATLNCAIFTEGSFVYVPEGVRCPMELSTYFRINAKNTGQFERTLIIAEKNSYVSYLEGCTAPQRDENQLHAAVVELVALEGAEIKYSTVQNWYPGDADGKGGIYNFVTKRGACRGARAKISWTQVETGSAITWKYPSCILQGDDSVGEFYSVALTNHQQCADTGTKMVHIGKNTRSTIISKGISAGHSQNTYRGLVRVLPSAAGARNYTRCDSLLIGDQSAAHTVPYIESRNKTAQIEHEATASKVSDDHLFYCRARGLSEDEAVGLIINGFCREVLQALPMEFAVEAQKLIALSLEGSVG